MGYETLLMIGRKTNQFDFKNGKFTKTAWFQEVARIDMNKTGTIYNDDTSPIVFIYADNGDTRIYKDRYGAKLRAYPLDTILAQLKEYLKDDDWSGSHILPVAISMLEQMNGWGFKDNPMAVVLFGY